MRTEDFYSFLRERERIRLRKESGAPWPWTNDRILQSYKFTNVHRHNDKTSRKLNELLYAPNDRRPRAERLMNAAIARWTGTWEFNAYRGWWQDFSAAKFVTTCREFEKGGGQVFTGAYMISNFGRDGRKDQVIGDILQYLWTVIHKIIDVVVETESWEATAKALSHQATGFGGTGFMCKEVLLDTMFSPGFWSPDRQFPVDYDTWTPIGPGGLRGAARVAGVAKLPASRALSVIKGLWDVRSQFWPEHYEPLHLHDVQFQLCEFDKYERVRLHQGFPRSQYKPPR